MPKILMTGGNGLLGTEIQKLDSSIILLNEKVNVALYVETHFAITTEKPDIVLHLAAHTSPLKQTPQQGIQNNIIGTANVADICADNNIRLVYTSTDYNYVGQGPHKEDEPQLPPYNFGWSKLGGECAVVMIPNSLILRLSFGPRPFPWDKVYEGQTTSKLYVDEIAPLVLTISKSKACGIINLGGEPKTLEDYAKETKPDIETIPKPDWIPSDTSLDLTKMREWIR